MIVDVHAHVIVPGFGAETRWDARGQTVVFGGREIRSATREFVELPRILEEQDRVGVEVVVLSPWVQLLDREPERQNEALAIETTVAAAHLVMQGVLDDHPRLKIVLAHGGGAITTLRGRLQRAQSFQPPGRDVVAALRRFHFDTVVYDPDVLHALVDFAGADRVLLGSDYPFDMGDERPAEVVRALGFRAREEAAILGGNALRLIGRDG